MNETNRAPRPRTKERVPKEKRARKQATEPSLMTNFQRSVRQKIKHFDLWLFVPFFILLLFGSLMVYSASVWWGIIQYGHAPNHYYIRQLVFVALGFAVFVFAVFIKRKLYTNPFVVVAGGIITVILLIYVRLKGWGSNAGATSWFSIGGINVQPSEIAKLTIIIVMATILTACLKNRSADDLRVKHYALIFSYPLICIALVVLQPDLGAVAVMLSIMMAIFIVSGISVKKYMTMLAGIVVATGLAALIGVITGFINGNRLGRIKAWFDPFQYETIEGYQVIQGYVAIGSGGLGGVGLGQSAQKLGYLPEPHTDFIMAVISEELGMWGVLIVVGLLYTIVCRALFIALKTNDLSTRFIAAGIGTWIGIQTFINLGGMLGFIPLTGVTLPFISYGGTSTVLLSLSMGILMNISINEKMNERKKRKGDVAS